MFSNMVSGSNPQPPRATCYVFVDGAHLRSSIGKRTRNAFGEPIYPNPTEILNKAEAQKLFWFDCEDGCAKSRQGTDLDGNTMREIVDKCPRCHYISGYLAGKNQDRQKAVDVALAVYALDFALNHVIGKVVLLAGDGDFMYLANRLVRNGAEVLVWGDSRSTSQQLREEADDYWPINSYTMYSLFSPEERERVGHPERRSHGPNPSPDWKIEKTRCGKHIYSYGGRFFVLNDDGSTVGHPRLEWVRQYVLDGCP